MRIDGDVFVKPHKVELQVYPADTFNRIIGLYGGKQKDGLKDLGLEYKIIHDPRDKEEVEDLTEDSTAQQNAALEPVEPVTDLIPLSEFLAEENKEDIEDGDEEEEQSSESEQGKDEKKSTSKRGRKPNQ